MRINRNVRGRHCEEDNITYTVYSYLCNIRHAVYYLRVEAICEVIVFSFPTE